MLVALLVSAWSADVAGVAIAEVLVNSKPARTNSRWMRIRATLPQGFALDFTTRCPGFFTNEIRINAGTAAETVERAEQIAVIFGLQPLVERLERAEPPTSLESRLERMELRDDVLSALQEDRADMLADVRACVARLKGEVQALIRVVRSRR